MTSASVADTPRIYTIEEYLELEERSSLKHHFVKGKLINTPGGTLRHNTISSNIITAIKLALRQQSLPFLVSNSDTKIWVPVIGSFYYPDALKEFLIVHQDYRVAHLSSRVESDLWQLSTAEGTDKQIHLRSIGISIAMSDIYYKTEGL